MGGQSNTKNVLIVDDEPALLQPLCDRLRARHGDSFGILTAANGQEAIDVLEQKTVDLLVTDLEMPVMDGFELLAWTRRKRPDLSVIVMSALEAAELNGRLAQHEPLQSFEKPFEFDKLGSAIVKGLQAPDNGYIRGVALATFLQLMNLERKSCTLRIESEDRTGTLHLCKGQLVDAQTGALHGEEAAYEIVAWKDTTIEMLRAQLESGPISRPLELLLLDAFRLVDEQKKPGRTDTLRVPPRPVSEAIKAASKSKNEAPETASGVNRERVVKLLSSHPDVREFAWFGEDGSLDSTNSGQCIFEGIDPAIYLHLSGLLQSKIGLGSPTHISFFMADRAHIVLFSLPGCCLFIRLKEGVRPEVAAKDIGGAIRGDAHQSSLT